MRLTMSESMPEEVGLWVLVDNVVEPDRRLLSREFVKELVTLLMSDIFSSPYLARIIGTSKKDLSFSTHLFAVF